MLQERSMAATRPSPAAWVLGDVSEQLSGRDLEVPRNRDEGVQGEVKFAALDAAISRPIDSCRLSEVLLRVPLPHSFGADRLPDLPLNVVVHAIS